MAVGRRRGGVSLKLRRVASDAGYGVNLKPVNPSVLHDLGEKPAPVGLRPAPKTPPFF